MSAVASPLFRPSDDRDRKALPIGATASVLLHAAALFAAYVVINAPAPTPPAVPIMVNMIAAPQPEPVKPPPHDLPKPLPVHAKPMPTLPQPVLTAAPNTAAVPTNTAPAPQPPAPVVAAPADAPVAPAIVAPRFDAAYLDNPAPPYPPMSRRMGEQGKVQLRVLVNADGTAAQVELKASSGSARLDQSALDTVKRWRFVPAKQGTQAIAAWVIVPISFMLGG